MAKSRQISARLHLAEAAGLMLPAELKVALIDERNSVIHRGAQPRDARRAFAIATQALDVLDPLA